MFYQANKASNEEELERMGKYKYGKCKNRYR